MALARRWRSARRLLMAWGLFITAYLVLVAAVSWWSPPPQIRLAEDLRFDDWCIAVERVERGAHDGDFTPYRVLFRLSSRARRRPQREQYVTVYLLDGRNNRFEATTPDGQPPFDVLLSPDDAVETTREFHVPSGATPDRLVITHEGGFPIRWFIVGQGPFFQGAQLALR
jgi:hypothetical protein